MYYAWLWNAIWIKKTKHIFLREETTLLLFMLKKTAVIIVKYIYLIKIAYYNLAIYFIF